MIQPLHGGEVRRLDAAASARSGGPGGTGAARPSSEFASAYADARKGLLLISRIAGAPAKQAAELRPQPFRPIGAEVYDGFAFHVLARVIIVIGERRVETVAEEFNLIHGETAVAADVSGKSNALAVFQHARLAVHFNRERRTVRALDAEHAHSMKIRAVVAARLDAPRTQLFGQIGGGQSQPFRERGAPFEFVRSQIGQPFLQIIGPHSSCI